MARNSLLSAEYEKYEKQDQFLAVKVSISKKFARVTLCVLLIMALSLCLTSFAIHHLLREMFPSQLYGFDLASFLRDFNVDGEQTIPAWFSSSLLLSCSFLLAVIASGVESAGERSKRTSEHYRLHWFALSLIFALLSLDELVAIHELLVAPMTALFSPRGLLQAAWVIPGGAFVLVFFFMYLKFLLYLPAQTRRLFMVAGALYTLGALGLEMLWSLEISLHGLNTSTAFVLQTLEEFLEMTGIILFLYALMRHPMVRHEGR